MISGIFWNFWNFMKLQNCEISNFCIRCPIDYYNMFLEREKSNKDKSSPSGQDMGGFYDLNEFKGLKNAILFLWKIFWFFDFSITCYIWLYEPIYHVYMFWYVLVCYVKAWCVVMPLKTNRIVGFGFYKYGLHVVSFSYVM